MANNNQRCICIDSRAFDKCKAKKQDFINRYAAITTRYERIVNDLRANWKGDSAELFLDDADVIRRNIAGIADILANMCSTLDDIRAQLAKTDKTLGDFNRDPNAE
ncbi:MAG: WXG100 family type VII secretion target [Ruminococcus sp.]|nr:WXG100 family type VII secretion target [Ruminococcus sp.]